MINKSNNTITLEEAKYWYGVFYRERNREKGALKKAFKYQTTMPQKLILKYFKVLKDHEEYIYR